MSTTKYKIEERLEWRQWVTPGPLYQKPIHRWYVFPHSFTSELVHGLIDEWDLGPEDRILDPFVGAGTTVLAAKEKGIPATGYDLSPLAVMATQVKVRNYSSERLQDASKRLLRRTEKMSLNGHRREYPELVEKSLPGKVLSGVEAIDERIADLKASPAERDFFRLALFSVLPDVSRAVATGGWLKWIDRRVTTKQLITLFRDRVALMLGDTCTARLPRRCDWNADVHDVRRLPEKKPAYSAIITSPPYPNRHDYTRVFGVELMFGFLSWEDTRRLRYQSFESHPEAHPVRPELNGYCRPRMLSLALSRLRDTEAEERIEKMLDGYFVDLYLTLAELKRVLIPNGRVAVVLGNAQYNGVPFPVDEICARLGEQVGFLVDRIIVTRYRGNSAQQMKVWGRHPSRESVVFLFNKT